MNKIILAILAPTALALVTGCTPTAKNSIAGGHVDPAISGVDARLVPTSRINGQSEVETIQVLGLKFNKGVEENRVGCVGNRLPLACEFSLNPFVYPKFGSWELKTGVEVACGMVDGLKIPA